MAFGHRGLMLDHVTLICSNLMPIYNELRQFTSMHLFPTFAGPIFERLAFEIAPMFQKQVFQKNVFLVVILLYVPHIPRKPASMKEAAFGRLPQTGRAAKLSGETFMEVGFRGISRI